MAGKNRYAFLDSGLFPLVFFGGTTLFGCIFIAFAKINGVNALFSMAVPILLMLGYLALSLIAGKLRTHDEQTGDNLYYMGFLFTLTSLGASLYHFTSGNPASTDIIVQNFGIAISSTITGIALRILYNQVRRDPAGTEQKARDELADMTRRIITEMEVTTREFADFRRVCNQMLEEGFDEIARQAEQNGSQVRKAFDSMATEAIKPVQETSAKIAEALEQTFSRIEDRFSGIAEKVDTVAEHLDKANTSMADTVSKFEKQAENVSQKLQRLTIPDEVLKTDLVPVVKLLAATIGKYVDRAEQLSKDQAARTDSLTAAVTKLAEDQTKLVAQLSQQTERMSAQADKNAAALSRMLSEFLERELADGLDATNIITNGHDITGQAASDNGEQSTASPRSITDGPWGRPNVIGVPTSESERDKKGWLGWRR